MDAKNKKVLFLHGFTQNSFVLQKRLKVVTKTLKQNLPSIEFLFPDAPFILEETTTTSQEEVKRGWLYLNAEDKMNSDDFSTKSEVAYNGFTTSVNYLIDLAGLNPDIECIFGFSQGALITIFLSALIHNGSIANVFPNLKCIVLVSGFIYPFSKNEELEFYLQTFKNCYDDTSLIKSDEKIKIPVLNVFGECDEFIVPAKSEKVKYFYENCENYVHKGKHFIPTSKEDIEVFMIFLKKYLS